MVQERRVEGRDEEELPVVTLNLPLEKGFLQKMQERKVLRNQQAEQCDARTEHLERRRALLAGSDVDRMADQIADADGDIPDLIASQDDDRVPDSASDQACEKAKNQCNGQIRIVGLGLQGLLHLIPADRAEKDIRALAPFIRIVLSGGNLLMALRALDALAGLTADLDGSAVRWIAHRLTLPGRSVVS